MGNDNKNSALDFYDYTHNINLPQVIRQMSPKVERYF